MQTRKSDFKFKKKNKETLLSSKKGKPVKCHFKSVRKKKKKRRNINLERGPFKPKRSFFEKQLFFASKKMKSVNKDTRRRSIGM